MSLIIFFGCSLWGLSSPADELSEVTKAYRNQPIVEIQVQKINTMKWTAKKQTSTGKIFYSNGKIRWEIDTPEKVWSIYDGEKIWVIQFASPDFPGKNKVTRARISKKNRDQIFLAKLLQMKDISEGFKVTKENADGSGLIFKLEPKGKNATIFDIKIKINTKQNKILEISYKDDIENQTQIVMENTKFKSQKRPELFIYKPTKDDEVTDL